MLAGVTLAIAYIIVVISPLLLVMALHLHSPNELLYEIARSFGLSAFAILCLQSVLIARLKWMERPFGMDILSRFHKSMGVFLAIILLSHPPLLALGGGGWSLVTSLEQPWYIWLGRFGLLALVIHVFISVFSSSLGLTFEQWRRIHSILAPLIIVLVLVHSWETGDDLKEMPVRGLWIAFLVVFFAAYAYHKILEPTLLSRHPYRVMEVKQEVHNVWTVKLAPPKGEVLYDYYPGQFHFITFHRGGNLPVEEHHWTISSSPAQKDFISSTIKESGDFTSTIGLTKPGDEALVQGPFGRFSYVLHPDDKDMVFIAGGIGITPFMGMLRHMRDTKADLRVVVLYANRSEKDIVFRDELAQMEAGERPHLTVVHILSNTETDWPGEKGYVDRNKIERHAGPLDGKAFYVCGPPPMNAAVIETLLDIGVPYNQIRSEIFSL
jgi:predicted ferric reductase